MGAGSNNAFIATLLLVVSVHADNLPRFTVPLLHRDGRFTTDCAKSVPHRPDFCKAIDRILKTAAVDPAEPQLDFSSRIVPLLQREISEQCALDGPLENPDEVPLSYTDPLTFQIRPVNPAQVRQRQLDRDNARGLDSSGVATVLLTTDDLPGGAWYLLPTWAFHEASRSQIRPVELSRVARPAATGANLIDLGRPDGASALLISSDPPPARRFLGLAAEYKPAQGIRLTGITDFQSNANTLHLEAGTFGSGLAQTSWTRDLIAIRKLGIRLALTVDGGSTTTAHRLLRGRDTEERRTSTGTRLELEPTRDPSGHTVTLHLGARRETVAFDGTAAGITRIDSCLDYAWARRFKFRPAAQFARTTDAPYTVLRLDTEWRQFLPTLRPVEFSSRAHVAWASARTPIFDQPSAGGVDSLRGFREDTVEAHRLWSSQNELWVHVRRQIGFVLFTDIGTANGFRRGFGAGPGLRFKGVQIGIDYGFGFGSHAPASAGQLYFRFRII